MYQRTVTFFAVVALAGLLGTGSAETVSREAAHSGHLVNVAMAKDVTFATDPAAYGGGDQGMDNLYTLSNYICTDGIAVNVAYQALGDLGNTGHEAHSLKMADIRDFGTPSNTKSPPIQVPITDGAFPYTLFTSPSSDSGSDAGVGVPATNTDGTWTGDTQIVHYATQPVGEEIVASIWRLDHGAPGTDGVLNEDDDRSGGPSAFPNSNGDDSGNIGGWAATDDGVNGAAPPFGTGADGDFTANTDGSSFDDVLQTDQEPTSAGIDPTKPNNTPSFDVQPDPSTSLVEDCVVGNNVADDNLPSTTVTYSASKNSAGWFNQPVTVTFASHDVFYLATHLYFHYSLDGGSPQENSYSVPSELSPNALPAPSILVSGDAVHSIQYYWTYGDEAWDASKATSVTVKEDATAPTNVAFTWSGAPITEGQQFDYGDTVPAPSGCTVDSSNAGTGTQTGSWSYTATATDQASNSAQAVLHYSVVAWSISGFYQPVAMGGTWNQIKGGATVPLKFNVHRAVAGTEITDPTKITSYGATQVPCPSSPVTTTDTTVTTGASSLRYDTTSGQFIFNWQSPKGAGQCYQVSVTAGGSTATASFMTK